MTQGEYNAAVAEYTEDRNRRLGRGALATVGVALGTTAGFVGAVYLAVNFSPVIGVIAGVAAFSGGIVTMRRVMQNALKL